MIERGFKEFRDFLAEQECGSPIHGFVTEIIFEPSSDVQGAADSIGFSDVDVHYSATVTLGIAGWITAYTLFRLAKIYLDARTNRMLLSSARDQIAMARSISDEQQIPFDLAEKLLSKTLAAIARRGERDSAFLQILDAVSGFLKR